MEVSLNGAEILNINSDVTTITSTEGKLAFRIATNGHVRFPETVKLDPKGTPNVYIDSTGRIFKSSSTSYSTEEVDKKLAIKDKLIEKLEVRLKKIEDQLKKKKK